MEPIRTPSQSIVIFIFLMVTLFTYQGNGDDKMYAERYQEAEKFATGPVSMYANHYQIQKNPSLSDSLNHSHRASTQGRKGRKFKNTFSIFAYPARLVKSSR